MLTALQNRGIATDARLRLTRTICVECNFVHITPRVIISVMLKGKKRTSQSVDHEVREWSEKSFYWGRGWHIGSARPSVGDRRGTVAPGKLTTRPFELTRPG